ncbi:MAG: RidA family protein [Candidatus Sericytochromatia bacterium]
MGKIADRLNELGLTLPTAPKPVAAYIPAVHYGNLLFVSGQLPLKDGQLLSTGKVGNVGKVDEVVSVEDAYAAARQCTLNALSVAQDVLGDLDRIDRIIRVGGFVQSADGFSDQPKVINGASELLGEIFGEKGRHARAAVGVNELPLNASVEVEFVIGVAD